MSFVVLRFTRRCISVAPSRETAGELLLGKTLTITHSCSMHKILWSQRTKKKKNVLSEALTQKWLLVIQWEKLLFVSLLVHQNSLTLCCLTGKSGMYFVEDNAADAHDNQVKPDFPVQDYSSARLPPDISPLDVFMCLDRAFTGRPRHLLSPGRTKRSRRCTSDGGS